MDIFTYPLGQLQSNCYIVRKDQDCIIVDPGDSAEFILEEVQRKQLHPLALLATHGHFDHIMASGEIQLSFNIPLYIHEKDMFLVKRLKSTAQHFLQTREPIIPPINIKHLSSGILEVGPFKLEVLETPGHTPGGCCFYFKDEGVIFTGDTIFKEEVGNYSHQYSSLVDLKKSLSLLSKLPDVTLVYSGHGDESIMQDVHFSLSPPQRR